MSPSHLTMLCKTPLFSIKKLLVIYSGGKENMKLGSKESKIRWNTLTQLLFLFFKVNFLKSIRRSFSKEKLFGTKSQESSGFN